MMPELEPLEADVLSLLRAARPIADLEPTAKAAILASVEAQIGLVPGPGGGGGEGGAGGAGGPGAAAASGAASGGLAGARAIAAIVATFAIGVATGVVVAPAVTPPAAIVQSAPLSTRGGAEPAAKASTATAIDLPAVSVGSLPAASSPSSQLARGAAKLESPEVAAPSARGLGAERSLLDVARAALTRGEAAEALAAVDRHSRDYPDGVLVEEREAIAIKALVALGRRDDARARARTFEQRFPNGLMLRAVKGAVGDP